MKGLRDSKAFRIAREVVIVLSSAFCSTFVQMYVMIPNGMASGGLPGLTRIITHLVPLSYSLVYYSLSMVILVITYIAMGRTEVRRIVTLAFVYPVMLFIFEHVDYTFLKSPDPFLASVLMGVFYGLAIGIGYIGGYSSGGTDTLARVIKYRLLNFMKAGDVKMMIDISIILLSALVFDVNVAMYAIVTSVVTAQVTSAIMLGFRGRSVRFSVIPSTVEKGEEITSYVLDVMDRDVTSHISRGEYTKEERRTLSVICSPAECAKLKKHIAEVDPGAFAAMMPVTTVWGTHFSDIREVDNT